VVLGLPDKSGVPVVVSGCAPRESIGAGARVDQLLSLPVL
jgi:hypothetical protein